MRQTLLLSIVLVAIFTAGVYCVASRPIPRIADSGDQQEATSSQEDLNGDGTMEEITLRVSIDPVEGNKTILTINDSSVTVPGGNPEENVHVVDIDPVNPQKEVMVGDLGPSGDPTTNFYAYDGTTINHLGSTEGVYAQMTFDGKGGFTTVTRAHILDTWFYKDDYRLEEGKIARIPKDFYERLATGMEPITILRKLPLLPAPTVPEDKGFSLTLQKGDEVRIVGCDDVRWCQIQTMDGKTGWFSVSNHTTIDSVKMSAQAIFEGLSFAD